MNTSNQKGFDVEEERQKRLKELAEDQGPDWTEEYKPGSCGCHELLDRANMLAEMIEERILTHPACALRPEWYALADQACTALQELYQQVGAEHLNHDQ